MYRVSFFKVRTTLSGLIEQFWVVKNKTTDHGLDINNLKLKVTAMEHRLQQQGEQLQRQRQTIASLRRDLLLTGHFVKDGK